ncbi:MAG: hypothetical protein IJH88_00580 [Eggerthellaceae bacterium]|nr:hypothetical protein [Eggerthellaceae bacterium]
MEDSELRKKLLNGRKSERINFAVTPELKEAAATLAEERCTTVSSLIVSLLVDESLKNKDLVGGEER